MISSHAEVNKHTFAYCADCQGLEMQTSGKNLQKLYSSKNSRTYLLLKQKLVIMSITSLRVKKIFNEKTNLAAERGNNDGESVKHVKRFVFS